MIYEYDCKEHGVFEVVKRVAEHQKFETCPVCDTVCQQIFTTVNMQPDNMWNGYYSPNLGRYFTSKSQRDAYLKAKGLAIQEDGMKEQFEANRKHHEKQRDKQVEKDVAEMLKDA